MPFKQVTIIGTGLIGTSVALALDSAAQRYHAKLQTDVSNDDARHGTVPASPPCRGHSLYFHHAELSARIERLGHASHPPACTFFRSRMSLRTR